MSQSWVFQFAVAERQTVLQNKELSTFAYIPCATENPGREGAPLQILSMNMNDETRAQYRLDPASLHSWQPVDEFVAVPKITFSRIAFLSSHAGSAAKRVIAACGQELAAEPVIIVSNNPGSQILEYAKEVGIVHELINIAVCGSEAAVQERILERFTELKVDLVVLSGYMKKLGTTVISRYAGRILNIHPALLPKYGGQGMYGIHVHQAVIQAGDYETGITIHQVNQNYDEGPIVARLKVPVCCGDTPDILAKRVKDQEPLFLVRTLVEIQRRAIAAKTNPYDVS